MERLTYSNTTREKTKTIGDDLRRSRFIIDDFFTPSPATTEVRSVTQVMDTEKTQYLGYLTIGGQRGAMRRSSRNVIRTSDRIILLSKNKTRKPRPGFKT